MNPEDGGPGICAADCTEADLRAAVDYLNRSCPAGAALIFNGPSCTGSPTVIQMEQKVQGPSCNSLHCSSGPYAGASCATQADCLVASCGSGGDGVGNAVCIRGNNILIDGLNKVLFRYKRPTTLVHPLDGACCSDQCGNSEHFSALFSLLGTGNTVRNFDMEYFPEGIHIRGGSNNTVSNVRSNRICEDAVSVAGGTGHRIQYSALVGRQLPDVDGPDNIPGNADDQRECWVPCCSGDGCGTADPGCNLVNGMNPQATILPISQHWKTGVCARDKILQLNGGSSTIYRNRIDTPATPLLIRDGSHDVIDNSTTGDPAAPNACVAYVVGTPMTAPITATFRNNTITYCRYGIDLRPANYDVTVTATGNTIASGRSAALRVSPPGGNGAGKATLIARGNKFVGIGAGVVPHAALLVQDESANVTLDDEKFCRGSALPPDISTTCSGSTCAAIGVTDSCFTAAPQTEPAAPNGVTITPDTLRCSTAECLVPPAPFCTSMPASCRTAGSAKITLRRSSTNKLRWSWKRGTIATTLAEFGDPASSRSYSLCVYSAGQLVMQPIAPAGGACSASGAPCWSSYSVGWRYSDHNGTPQGLTSVRFKSGPAGKPSLRVKGDGPNLPFPDTLALSGPVVVQLQNNQGGPCWGASFDAATIRRSMLTQFDARF